MEQQSWFILFIILLMFFGPIVVFLTIFSAIIYYVSEEKNSPLAWPYTLVAGVMMIPIGIAGYNAFY